MTNTILNFRKYVPHILKNQQKCRTIGIIQLGKQMLGNLLFSKNSLLILAHLSIILKHDFSSKIHLKKENAECERRIVDKKGWLCESGIIRK